jgi:hypothetical protein
MALRSVVVVVAPVVAVDILAREESTLGRSREWVVLVAP